MSEFDGRQAHPNAKELFNLRHSSLRTTVERAFGALKGRFRILETKPSIPTPSQVKSVIIACCILHNWILCYGIDNLVPGEDFTEPASQPTTLGTQQPTYQEV
jgi:hypothetical protein